VHESCAATAAVAPETGSRGRSLTITRIFSLLGKAPTAEVASILSPDPARCKDGVEEGLTFGSQTFALFKTIF
jgi:hypothetical protein